MSASPRKEHPFSTIRFIIILCFASALILSVVATSLQKKQEQAALLNQVKELLVAAKILSSDQKHFLIQKEGKWIPAVLDPSSQQLVAGDETASSEEIFALYEKRVQPLLVDQQGDVFTFAQKNINEQQYLEENQKRGYAQLPLKLVYRILAEDLKTAQSYVIPINGFGLWDAIYGYLAIKPDGDTVIGTTWYEQKETPGLGAEISTPDWQEQFFGKLIFQKSADGSTNFQRAPLGIIVVKGSVKDVYGNSAKADSAVDGLSGATLTGQGVTSAYQDSLGPYRNFLIKLHGGK